MPQPGWQIDAGTGWRQHPLLPLGPRARNASGPKQSVPGGWGSKLWQDGTLLFAACRVGVGRQLGLNQREESEPQELVDL